MSRWKGATVLITGGTGWFGRHFVQHALEKLDLHAVRVYSRDEHKQHLMRQRWPDMAQDSKISYIVGDIRDKDRLIQACRGTDIIVHAAALKRVEGSATHARELMKTNVLGSANVVDAALTNQVRWTLAISSDKGCMPVNAYGKTKAMMEDLMIEGNAIAGGWPSRFSCVRYGNVLGSTGSVLSLWRAAHDACQPLPITDPGMTRFWITAQQAVEFVVACVEAMEGGEIFLPPMPRSTLGTLAKAIYGDDALAQAQMAGERFGGEKLHEALLGEDEARHTYKWACPPYCFMVAPQQPTWNRNYQPIGALLDPPAAIRSNTPPMATLTELRALLTQAGIVSVLSQQEPLTAKTVMHAPLTQTGLRS